MKWDMTLVENLTFQQSREDIIDIVSQDPRAPPWLSLSSQKAEAILILLLQDCAVIGRHVH